jgi:hypothetical protein
VFCVKFQRELPGLDEPPFDNELGQRIYEQVSRDAWALWMEHCKMILNDYETAPIYRRVGGGENRSPGRASSSSIIISEDAENIRTAQDAVDYIGKHAKGGR